MRSWCRALHNMWNWPHHWVVCASLQPVTTSTALNWNWLPRNWLASQTCLLSVSLLISPSRVPYFVSRIIPILVTAVTANLREPHYSECPVMYLSIDKTWDTLFVGDSWEPGRLSAVLFMERSSTLFILVGFFSLNPIGSFASFIKVNFNKSFRMLLGNKNM